MRAVFVCLLAASAAMYVVAEATVERPRDEGVVLLRWATDKNPARDVQTAEFSTRNPGIRVTVDSGDRAKIIVQCATGVGPDLIDVWDISNMMMFHEGGILLDLTEHAKRMGFDPSKTYPGIRECLMVDGRQYRFPCNVWANCVVYNRRIFSDLGVAEPTDGWTYDDFIRLAGEIRARGQGRLLAVANWNKAWLVLDMLIGAGGRLYRLGRGPDGRPQEHGLASALDSDEAVAVMQRYYDMMHTDRILPTPAEASALTSAGGWGSGALTWFSTGKAAMISIGRWYTVHVPRYPNLRGNVCAVRLPRWGDRPSQGMCDCRAAAINANSQHVDEALKFLQYLASEAYGRIIVSDGDALPPNPALATSGRDLANDAVPDPAFHQPFVDAVKHARPLDVSLFIDAGQVDRWLKERIDQVENIEEGTPREKGLELAAGAMRSLAAEINTTIRTNLRRRPDLQRTYERITGRKYTPDWWRHYQTD